MYSLTRSWTLEIDNDTPTDNFENAHNEGNDSIFDEITVDYNKDISKIRRKENLDLNPPTTRYRMLLLRRFLCHFRLTGSNIPRHLCVWVGRWAGWGLVAQPMWHVSAGRTKLKTKLSPS